MNRITRKIISKLHLYLGLLSGVVVFIVCITGCLYVFKDEVTSLSEPWRQVEVQNKSIQLPSQIEKTAETILPGKPSSITYGEPSDAIVIDYFTLEAVNTIYIDPYDGKVIKTIEKKKDSFYFFDFIIEGHKSLWLPRDIGRPIVGYSILTFLITLITGIVLWYPKKWNKKTIKNIFSIRIKSSFSKINFDLHNVLGGYVFLILIIIAFTGLVRSLTWFSEGVYYATNGGRQLQAYTLPESGKKGIEQSLIKYPLDELYLQVKASAPYSKSLYFTLPYDKSGCFRVSISHKKGMYYTYIDNLFFDQYTLQPLEGTGPYSGKYAELSAADKFRRMNLDIHDGRILGIFGKIIAFLASLTGASLPITGFIIWLRKHK